MLTSFGLLLVAAISGVNAFPYQAGSCAPGKEAILTPQLSHATKIQVGTGPLSDKGLVVLLNGMPLADSGTNVSVGTTHKIMINSTSGDAFRGFLLRLDGNGNYMDADLALNPIAGDELVQVSTTCVDVYSVGGITHTSNIDKTVIVGTLKLDGTAQGMTLDITVVISNNVSQNVSEWYFSSYSLDAIQNTSVVTVAPATSSPGIPSASPLGSGASDAPSNAPVISTAKPTTSASYAAPFGWRAVTVNTLSAFLAARFIVT